MSNIQEREAALYMQAAKRMPITITRGSGSTVWDDEGKEYLDFVAGIATNALGHADPGLAAVIAEQAQTLLHTSNIFYTEPQIALAELLIAHSCMDRVFFTSSGAEANEGAIKLARKWGRAHRDGAFEIIAADDSFHGRTMATVSATGTPRYREPFAPELPGFSFVPFNDIEALRAATTDRTAAVMLEPIQGEGGINVPDPGYLAAVRAWCDQMGMLLIFDEVQTGCGRTGTLWAYEQTGIEPDIMTLAKALGGGVPIGALLAKEHASVFEPGDHGSTFGGNALATAAATHVVTRLVEGGLVESARERGVYLRQRLNELEDRHPAVSGVRGAGLLLGLELSEDIAPQVVQAAARHGLLANAVRPNVVRLMPALTVTDDESDEAVRRLTAAIDEVTNNR